MKKGIDYNALPKFMHRQVQKRGQSQLKPGEAYIGVSVGALIFNKKGEIFLTKRSQKTNNEHGCWEAPGGGVEFGETLQNAIKREIKEEYGVNIILLKQLPAQNHLLPKEGQHWVPTSFIAKIKKGQTPKIMEPEKCDNIDWFPLNKLPKPLSVITKLDLKVFKKDKIYKRVAENI